MNDHENFVGKSLRVFISYSKLNGVLAREIQLELKRYGIEVFLAHEDIPPCSKWEDVMFSSLKQTDVVILLLTNEFKESSWCDQETGIAVATEKFIIPLKVEINPYGFVAKHQALKFSYDITITNASGTSFSGCENVCLEIIKLIAAKDELRENLKGSLINGFDKSNTYSNSSRIAQTLNMFSDFSKEQATQIVYAGATNRQNYQARGTKDFLKKILSEYKEKIPEEIKSLLNEKLSS